MNEHGSFAHQIAREHHPEDFDRIPNPEAFFTGLGLEVQARISEILTEELSRTPGDDTVPLTVIGLGRSISHSARDRAYREIIFSRWPVPDAA